MGILKEILIEAAFRRGDSPPEAKQIPMPYVTQPRKERKKEAEGYIYFAAKDSGEIKIGCSAHPEERVKEGRTWRPDLRLVATMPGDKNTEAAVHNRLERYSMRGELFRISGELRDLIHQVRQKYGPPGDQPDLPGSPLLPSSQDPDR